MSSKAQLAGKTIVLKMKYMKLLLTILAVRPFDELKEQVKQKQVNIITYNAFSYFIR